MADRTEWRNFLEPWKHESLLLWQSLTFSSGHELYGLFIWVIFNFLCILMHINSHGVLHFIGILMIMSGLTAFLISQLAKYGIVMPPWTQESETEYLVLCKFLDKVDKLYSTTRRTLLESRKERPVKFYVAAIGVLLMCQMTIVHLPLSWLLHAGGISVLLAPLVFRRNLQALMTQLVTRLAQQPNTQR